MSLAGKSSMCSTSVQVFSEVVPQFKAKWMGSDSCNCNERCRIRKLPSRLCFLRCICSRRLSREISSLHSLLQPLKLGLPPQQERHILSHLLVVIGEAMVLLQRPHERRLLSHSLLCSSQGIFDRVSTPLRC